jgi:hypothetical protein
MPPMASLPTPPVYFGETEACAPLYDPQGQIARLKEAVRT